MGFGSKICDHLAVLASGEEKLLGRVHRERQDCTTAVTLDGQLALLSSSIGRVD